ncbi:hypothetical protein L211DRAFT_851718 [Terfezia boudieri ATCC MYA-4762]|uniref:Uncharacterized protein n=1 Tax=Terfezia boudieri ATCC MYA-4762 TaxID=1051890 RepID=A0A3N4LE14_9PEZI|nr:hypothetical protein L211DRAFT_851718 [Terfezia boudieri ATCC MYA-4762]
MNPLELYTLGPSVPYDFHLGAELYNRPGIALKLESIWRLEYTAYVGDSHEKLGWIVNVEVAAAPPPTANETAHLRSVLQDFTRPTGTLGWGQGGHMVLLANRRGHTLWTQPPRDRSTTYSSFLGDMATVADGELEVMHLSLSMEVSDTIAILSDSRPTVQTISNKSQGGLPRPGVEANIKGTLIEPANSKDVWTAWVMANEKADQRASYESILGELKGTGRTATQGGVRAASKAVLLLINDEDLDNEIYCKKDLQIILNITDLQL